MTIAQQLLRPNKFTRPGMTLQKVKAIAVHYTGDPGATAQNERDYFNGTCINQGRYASCHYVVGLQGEVIQLIPDNEWSYCTNQANSYALSIEVCHPDESGKFTAAAEQSLIELVVMLCKKYGLTADNVIRHYDVTKKICPKYYVDHSDAWAAFKTAVGNAIAGQAYILPSWGTTAGDVKSDTTQDIILAPGKSYIVKLTASTAPAVTIGTAGVVTHQLHKRIGNDYLYRLTAIGKPGTAAGIYVNDKKIFAVKIK